MWTLTLLLLILRTVSGKFMFYYPLLCPFLIFCSSAPKPLPAAKTTNSNKPKPATSTKAVRGPKPRRGRGGRSGSGSGREKKKTADELDAEMADYFDGGNTQTGAATTTGAPATNGGDIGMDDDVLVGTPYYNS